MEINTRYTTRPLEHRDIGVGLPPTDIVSTKPSLLTINEMGKLFRVSTRTIQRWSDLRLIPFVKIGRTIRYDITDAGPPAIPAKLS